MTYINKENNIRQRYTVFICTRNRDKLLSLCLSALAPYVVDKLPKIFIIDNASSDRTYDVYESYKDIIQYDYVNDIGLSNAKNRAISLCETEYIVFLDDDSMPEPTWLDGIEEAIRQNADVFGGPYVPYYLCERPNWFLDHFGSAHLELSDGIQHEQVLFSGGNMGFRSSVLRQMNGFDRQLGMSGNQLGLGEETKLQMAIHRGSTESRFVFSSKMLMKHLVAREKMSVFYICRRSFLYGISLSEIDSGNELLSKSVFSLLKIMRFGSPIIYSIFVRDRRKYRYWVTYVAFYLSAHAIIAGVIAKRLKAILLEKNEV